MSAFGGFSGTQSWAHLGARRDPRDPQDPIRRVPHLSPEQVWPKLRALYETGPPPDPHRYWPGDWVYMQRHQQQTLQPHWKGPYIVILTTPTALKVDGVTPWVHYTHIRPADPHTILKDFVPE
eukprot:XP_022279831.1 uncharacterized protein LOC106559347 isoform X3 [Canis lupus familiaris]